MCDEITDCSNKEQLSLAIRFVDEHSLIREEFLNFIEVERIMGESLANAILLHLESWDIPIINCKGQEHDGTANMSSSLHGVQSRIREHAPFSLLHSLSSTLVNLMHSQGLQHP